MPIKEKNMEDKKSHESVTTIETKNKVRDLTLRKEIKKEVNAYKALCEKKSRKYESFADMRAKLSSEIREYDKDERERVYECYKNYIEKTNVFVSSIIPMLAAFAISVFSLVLNIANCSGISSAHCAYKICDVHSECYYMEYNQGSGTLAWIAFAITVVALAFIIIDMARDSDRGIREKGFYQMVVQLIESIEKSETENSTLNLTDDNCVVPQSENPNKDSERSPSCQLNTPSTCESPVQTAKRNSGARVKLSRVTKNSASKSQSEMDMRLRIFIRK